MTTVSEVIAVDDQGATIRTFHRDDAGKVDEELGTVERKVKWDWLIIVVPIEEEEVRISRERITVPVGTFDCLRYDISKKGGGDCPRHTGTHRNSRSPRSAVSAPSRAARVGGSSSSTTVRERRRAAADR